MRIPLAIACAVCAISLSGAQFPETDIFPDCASSQLTLVCASGGNVVQSLSANPEISPLGIQGWAFIAQATSPTVNWRFFESAAAGNIGPLNSPIASASCSNGQGVTFEEFGSSGAVDSGSVWFVGYLGQASNALQPLLRISSQSGCNYDYSIPSSFMGGPAYFYTNIDDNSHPEIGIRYKLSAPLKSSVCVNTATDAALRVSSLSIRSNAVTTALPNLANFVVIYAGYVSGPSASQINCLGSFNFLFLRPIAMMIPNAEFPMEVPIGINTGVFVKGNPGKSAKIVLDPVPNDPKDNKGKKIRFLSEDSPESFEDEFPEPSTFLGFSTSRSRGSRVGRNNPNNDQL